MCFLGTEPSFETCMAHIQDFIYETEEQCQETLYYFVETNLEMWNDKLEIVNLGCTSYLPSQEKQKL